MGKTTRMEQKIMSVKHLGSIVYRVQRFAMLSAGGSVTEMVRRLRTGTLQALIFITVT